MGLVKKAFTLSNTDYYRRAAEIYTQPSSGPRVWEDSSHLWCERVDGKGGGGSAASTHQIYCQWGSTYGFHERYGHRIAIKTDGNGCSSLSISIPAGKSGNAACNGAKYFVGKIRWAITSSWWQHELGVAAEAKGGHTPDWGMVWSTNVGSIDHVDASDPTLVHLSGLGTTTFSDKKDVKLLPNRYYYLWIWPEPDERYTHVKYNNTTYPNQIAFAGTVTLTPSGTIASGTKVAAMQFTMTAINPGETVAFDNDLYVGFKDMAIEPTIFEEPNYPIGPVYPIEPRGAMYACATTYEISATTRGPNGETHTEMIFVSPYTAGSEDFDASGRLTTDVYGPYTPKVYDPDDPSWDAGWPMAAPMMCCKWTPSTSVYGPIYPNTMTVPFSITANVYYTTENGGRVLVGTASQSFTIRFPDSVKPVGIPAASSFAVYNSDADKVGWAANSDLLIQGHSRIKGMFDRAAVEGTYDAETGQWVGGTWENKYGAYLTQWVYTVTQGGQTKKYTYSLINPGSYTSYSISDPIESVPTAKITVTDSRGNTVETSYTHDLTTYTQPSVDMSSGFVQRSARVIDDTQTPPVVTDDVYESEDGRFMSTAFSARFASLSTTENGQTVDNNIITVKIATKRHSETDTGNIDTWPRVDVYAYPSSSSLSATQVLPVGTLTSAGNMKSYTANVTMGKNYMYDHTNNLRKTSYVTMGEVGGELTFVTENTRNYEAGAGTTGYEDFTYDVWIEISDRLGYKSSYRTQMYSAKWAMKFMDDASGVAFGKAAEMSNRMEIPDTWDYYTGDAPVVSTKRTATSLELTMTQRQNARLNIGMLRFESVTVSGSWAQEQNPPNSDYPYKVAVSLAGVTENDIPNVYFSPAQIETGIFAPFAVSYGSVNASTGLPSNNGGVYLYASEQPSGSIVIPVIQFN